MTTTRWRRHGRQVACVAASGLLLAACGRSSSGSSAPSTSATTSAVPSTTASAAVSASSPVSSTGASGVSSGSASAIASALSPAGAQGAVPGVTATTISIGGSGPITGAEAPYGAEVLAAAAYFKYVDANDGGVTMADGVKRSIKYTYYDDQYDAGRALQNAERLVDQDHVFALFGVVGTPAAEGVRPFLNQNQVPELFATTPTAAVSTDISEYPWTIGFNLASVTEGTIDGHYIATTLPDAKVGILYLNNAGDQDDVKGFEAAIQGTKVKVVDSESYEATDTTVASQMAKLASSGANVFFNLSTAAAAAQSITTASNLGWHPLQLLASVGANATILSQIPAAKTQGIKSLTYLKDPSDPRWAADAGMTLYKSVMKQYAPTLNSADNLAVIGFAAAESLVSLLQSSQPTRASVMANVRQLKNVTEGLFLPGVTLNTSATDLLPIGAAYQEQWINGRWNLVGGALS